MQNGDYFLGYLNFKYFFFFWGGGGLPDIPDIVWGKQ